MSNIVDDPFNRHQTKTTTEIVSPRWVDIRDQDALAHMRRLREDAALTLQRMQSAPVELSPLELAQDENSTLRAKVHQLEEQIAVLTAELGSKAPAHQRKLEKR